MHVALEVLDLLKGELRRSVSLRTPNVARCLDDSAQRIFSGAMLLTVGAGPGEADPAELISV